MIASDGSMTFAEAQRAIYIDFGRPQGSHRNPPRAALLGVLVGSDGEQLEQLIVDERLASARVASPRCRVATAADAVSELLVRARTEGRAIVGWSLFDRDRMVEAVPECEEEINARYVNGLQIARPWRNILHPAVPIVRAGSKSPRHTLDQYARLAAYPGAAQLNKAEPARWILETVERLDKANGVYGALSKTGKRHWHRLLEYNRHDCLALRHIVLKASRELECWRAYCRTRFFVNDAGREVCFTNGSSSARLDALLARHRVSKWAFITAWNPASTLLSRADNDEQQRKLVRQIASSRYEWLPGEGRGEDPSWAPEESLLVLNIPEGKAVALGRLFGQMAILVGRRGSPARLVACS